MRSQPARIRVKAAVLVLCGIAAIAVAVAVAIPAFAADPARQAPRAAAPVSVPVVGDRADREPGPARAGLADNGVGLSRQSAACPLSRPTRNL